MTLERSYKLRILLVALILLFMMTGAIARLYHLQVIKHKDCLARAINNQIRKKNLLPLRGEILDRKENALVVTKAACSINVDSSLIPEKHRRTLSRKLAQVLDIPQEKICDLLKKNKGHFPLARKESDETMCEISAILANLGISKYAIYPLKECQRIYPHDSLLAPVIGFTNMDKGGDNIGVFGLEKQYNEWINGEYKKTYPHRTALWQDLEPIEQKILEATYGNRIVTTIDISIQYAIERALRNALSKWHADYGVAIVQEVKTGEILAMASLPTFDPNKFYSYGPEFRQNRCLSMPFEPGSVMKNFTSAIALDLGLVRMEEMIDCEHGRAIVDGWRVTDSGGHGMGVVPFTKCFANSSNIAFAKVGMRIEPTIYYSYLNRFGFGQKTEIDLPEESSGIMHPLEKWNRHSRKSLSYGYEIALTPIQTITAVSAMGNGGKLMKPYVVSEIQDYKGSTIQKFTPCVKGQVVSPDTAQKVLQLMAEVIDSGTAKKAKIKNFLLCAKTGTTRKSHVKDRTEYIASFAAIFPIDNPRISCYVAIDNPRGAYYAADVAAPVFREVAEQILAYLALPPTFVEPEPTPACPQTASLPNLATELEDELPALTIEDGMLPDLKGLTMKEALEALGSAAVDVQFIGSGVVVEQQPAPSTPLSETKTCMLVFGKQEPTPARQKE